MIWSEADRQIYVCPVTGVKLDPLAAKRRLTIESGGKFNELLAGVRSEDALAAAQAQETLLSVARRALALPADTLDAAVYDSLTAFTRYIRGKGPRAQKPPISAPCTDCPPASRMNRMSRSS